MTMKKLLCLVLALMMCGTMALAETEDLQSQLDAANARIAELEAAVELYKPYYDEQVIIEYDGGAIFYDEVMEEYSYTESMYANYGISLADYGYAEYYQQEAANMLLSLAVMRMKAAELGLDELDENATAGLTEEANTYFESYISTVSSSLATEDSTEEEVREQAIEYLNSMGYTVESILEDLVASYIEESVYNYIVADVAATEEDVQATYDALVAEHQESFASDSLYSSSRNGGETILWNPEGYRVVKHVLVKFDDDQTTRYSELSDTLDSLESELAAITEEETERTAEVVQAEIDGVNAELEALYAELLPTAEEVIEKFNGGTAFADLIDEYGEDPGMQNEPTKTNGYAISEASITSGAWDVPFAEGAMAIEAVGGISGPVYGANGIHIIYYESDIPAGAVEMESVRDYVEDTALTDKISDVYNDTMTAWIEALNPVYHYDRLSD